jgi:pimeloyl-ACP methyl ester carboxylesterase
MNKTAILLIVIASLSGSVGKTQTLKDMTENQVTIRDKQVEINYFQQGQGNTTLLFIHGWCIDGRYWKSQVDYFSANYAVYAIDLPGFGKSKAERQHWTIEEYALDITAFIDTLNLKNVVIVGHSMAGDIMLQTALGNNPAIVGLIGVDNFKAIDVVMPPEQMEQITAFFSMLQQDFKNTAPAYADMMLFHPTTSKEVKDRVKADFAGSNSVVGYETLQNMVQYSSTNAQRLEQLNYKLYLINSDGSPTNESGLGNHCKNGYEVLTISDTGHYPMIEKPTEFNLMLEKALAKMK